MPTMSGCSTILLDHDQCESVNIFAIRQRLRGGGLHILRILKRRSPSGKGINVVIYVKGCISDAEKVAVSAIRESDMNKVIQSAHPKVNS